MDLSVQPDMNLDALTRVCYGRSTLAGWWDCLEVMSESDQQLLYATKICLMHSELSEMMEGLRKGLPDDHLPHRTMEEVEAADVLIRLLDYCGTRKIDLAGALCEKLEYNAQRADHKKEVRDGEGGKTF